MEFFGVCGVPELLDAADQASLPAVGHKNPLIAVSRIRKQQGVTAVVLRDDPAAAVVRLGQESVAEGRLTIALRTPGAPAYVTGTDIVDIELPVSINEVLEVLGVGPVPGGEIAIGEEAPRAPVVENPGAPSVAQPVPPPLPAPVTAPAPVAVPAPVPEAQPVPEPAPALAGSAWDDPETEDPWAGFGGTVSADEGRSAVQPSLSPGRGSPVQATGAVEDPFAVADVPGRFEPQPAIQPRGPGAAAAVESRVDSLFDPSPVSGRDGRAAVVFTTAPKGGVGKSTLSLGLANLAAEAGLRVILVDMNRGQADVGTALGIKHTDVATIFNASLTGNVQDALLTPAAVTQARGALGPVGFGVILAPGDAGTNDMRQVTPALYRRALEFARRQADLVVVDTQVRENRDQSGLFDTVVDPILAGPRGYSLAVATLALFSVNNMVEMLQELSGRGVPASRIYTLVNDLRPGETYRPDLLQHSWGRHSRFLGSIGHSEQVKRSMDNRQLPGWDSTLAPVLGYVLGEVTGDEECQRRALAARKRGEAAGEQAETAEQGRRKTLFGRLFQGRR